ncbi:hypothetical protein ACFL5O_02090 [Myxococcota bacterium]
MARQDEEKHQESTGRPVADHGSRGEALSVSPGAIDDRRAVEAGEDDNLRNLVRDTLGQSSSEQPNVLAGVQRKLRQRSGGKFYAEGWSTSRQPPIQTYLVTSLVMLAVLFAVYAVLSPLSGAPLAAEAPAPVQVLPVEKGVVNPPNGRSRK